MKTSEDAVSTSKSARHGDARDGDGEEGKAEGSGGLDTREGLHTYTSTTLAAALQDLRDVDPDTVLDWAEGETTRSVRMMLKNVLTQAASDPSEEVLRRVDRLLLHELKSAKLVRAADLPRVGAAGDLAKLAVWQGDITTLEIGAIVNAANDRMLGCFKPNHPCIDNIIHSKAGPRLRKACREFMLEQGHPEETGDAKITPAYCLPCDYVLHTVGPIAQYRGHEQPSLLASCYTSCLDLAKATGVRSVAFCCISTGVFGYPQAPAACVALQAVRQWLSKAENDSAMDLVVFNVFTDTDLELYSAMMRRVVGAAGSDGEGGGSDGEDRGGPGAGAGEEGGDAEESGSVYSASSPL